MKDTSISKYRGQKFVSCPECGSSFLYFINLYCIHAIRPLIQQIRKGK